ncbi:UNVERIFIED_ORG: ABC-2 type transport system permease protein [Martelella mediterranea]
MDFGNVLQLGIKEIRGLLRDPIMMFLILFSFTFQIQSSAQMESEVLNHAPIAIVDEDGSPLSTRIIHAFQPPYFSEPSIIGWDEMDRRMDEGLDTFALDIPPDFQSDVLAGKRPEIQLNVDATQMTQAFSGAGYVQTIVSDEVAAFVDPGGSGQPPPAELVLRARFNPVLNSGWFQAVMGVSNSVTLLALILPGAALIREREHGTIEHLLVMPVTALEIMVSKLWSMSLVVLLGTLFATVVMCGWVLGIPLQGSLTLFLVGTALHLFATASLGILLATFAKTMPQFGIMMILVLLPLQILSGSQTPRESMPDIVQNIMLAAPNTHYVILAQSILFRGAGLDVVWPQMLWLAAIAAILFAISLRYFRRFLQ